MRTERPQSIYSWRRAKSPAGARLRSQREESPRGEEPRAAGARAREGSGSRSRPFGRAANRWRSQIPNERKRRLRRFRNQRPDMAAGDVRSRAGQDRWLRRPGLAQLGDVCAGLLGDDLEDFFAVQDFLLQKSARKAVHDLRVVRDELLGPLVLALDDLLDLGVDLVGGLLRVVLRASEVAAEEDLSFDLAESQRPHVAHAPLAD